MAVPSQHAITHLLLELRQGNPDAFAQLVPLVYTELRSIAAASLRGQQSNLTLRTTDLVHEAFLKMVGTENKGWENRAHFFSIAATAMRQIIIDEARKRNAAKRGGARERVALDEGAILTEETAPHLVALDEALKELATVDERMSRIVELRFFTGLSIEETAEVLAISPATVKREWSTARAWLFDALSQSPPLS